jgi:thiamine transporter
VGSEEAVRERRTIVVTEVGLSVALAAVLSLFKITLPWNFAGGSISLAMLPLIVLAVRRGVGPGLAAGLVFGLFDYLIEPFFVHPVQFVLDYPVAFAACGLAGLVRTGSSRLTFGAAGGIALMAALIAGSGRFVASFISGLVFFGANAPAGQPAWLYSLLYNASYLLPSIAACAVTAAVVVPAIDRAIPVPRLES